MKKRLLPRSMRRARRQQKPVEFKSWAWARLLRALRGWDKCTAPGPGLSIAVWDGKRGNRSGFEFFSAPIEIGSIEVHAPELLRGQVEIDITCNGAPVALPQGARVELKFPEDVAVYVTSEKPRLEIPEETAAWLKDKALKSSARPSAAQSTDHP